MYYIIMRRHILNYNSATHGTLLSVVRMHIIKLIYTLYYHYTSVIVLQ